MSSLPVGIGAIRTAPAGWCPELEGVVHDGRLVELDAQARGGREGEAAALGLETNGEEVARAVAVVPREILEEGEVGGGAGEVDGGGGGDRPEGVVGHEVDVVGLAPTGDLARFSDPTDVAEVEPRKVEQSFLDEGREGPFARELFSDRERDSGHRAELAVGGRVLAADGFLDEEQVQVFDALAEERGFGRVKAVVEVDRECDLVAKFAPEFAQPVDGGINRIVRVVDGAVDAGPVEVQHAGGEAEHAPPLGDGGFRFVDDLWTGESARGGEAWDALAHGAAEQLPDWHAERFAEDVPEGDVDGRDDRCGNLAALEVGAAVEQLP